MKIVADPVSLVLVALAAHLTYTQSFPQLFTSHIFAVLKPNPVLDPERHCFRTSN